MNIDKKLTKALNDKSLKLCLLNELLRLSKISQYEDQGLNIFEDSYWGDYEVFYLVLEKLGIGKEIYYHTDAYTDLYFRYWCNVENLNMSDVDDLLTEIVGIYKYDQR